MFFIVENNVNAANAVRRRYSFCLQQEMTSYCGKNAGEVIDKTWK